MALLERTWKKLANTINLDSLTSSVIFEPTGLKQKQLFISGIHLDELETSNILKGWFKNNPHAVPNSLKVLRANPEKTDESERGVLKWTWRGKKPVDANRGYGIPDKVTKNYWVSEEIKDRIKDYPDLEYIFSFHEDIENEGYRKEGDKVVDFNKDNDSFYMYDIFTRNEGSDRVLPLFDELRKTLRQTGFGLYTGLDDYKPGTHETVQGNPVHDGYCPQESVLDGSFENWMVDEGEHGLNKVKRSFIFEIPKNLTTERKQEMIKIIFDKFIIPFLKQAPH